MGCKVLTCVLLCCTAYANALRCGTCALIKFVYRPVAARGQAGMGCGQPCADTPRVACRSVAGLGWVHRLRGRNVKRDRYIYIYLLCDGLIATTTLTCSRVARDCVRRGWGRSHSLHVSFTFRQCVTSCYLRGSQLRKTIFNFYFHINTVFKASKISVCQTWSTSEGNKDLDIGVRWRFDTLGSNHCVLFYAYCTNYHVRSLRGC